MAGYNLRGIASFDGSRFEAGVNRMAAVADAGAKKIGQSFGRSITSKLGQIFAVGTVVAGFEALIRNGVTYAASLKDLTEQHELTYKEVQKIQKVADDAGLSFENYANAISHFGDVRQNAIKGDEKARKLLQDYGLTLDQILDPTLRNVDAVQLLGGAISKLKLTPEQRADLKDIFGRGGNRLISSLPKIGGQELSMELSEKTIKQAEKVDKQLNNLRTKSKIVIAEGIFGVGKTLRNLWNRASNDRIQRGGGAATSSEAGSVPTMGQSTVNGISDPLYFSKEAEHAQAMNELYRKGLEIQFERLGTMGKIREMNREIAALEIAREETAAGESQRDKEEAQALQRQIEQKKLELQNFQQSIHPAIGSAAVSERGRLGAFSGENPLLRVGKEQVTTLNLILNAIRNPRNNKKGAPIRVK